MINKEKSIKYIADHYGADSQLQQLIEEMAELTQAICKYFRANGKGQCIYPDITNKEIMDNLKEEIADVSLVLAQIIYLFDCEEEIDRIAAEKALRTAERMG